MAYLLRIVTAVLVTLTSLSFVGGAQAQAPEPRIALVIGNSSYRAGSLTTPANDAGLVAQTLTQAGFDVVGARDLDQEGLRRSFRDFIEKAAASGPDTIAFVYLAGYGLQYSGENYFAPVEASIARDSSVPIEALRISDFTRALADLPLKARFVVLDAARANPFAPTGQPLAGGLALVEPEAGSLLAFNAAPGTIAPDETGDYGAYARALSEMLHEGGLDVAEIFSRTRLRVSEATRGAQVPWHATRLTQPVVFFERADDAPPVQQAEAPRNRAIRDLPVVDAYALALQRDTIDSYQEFMTAYPRDPLSPRVAAMLAARREAVTWRRAVARNTPAAYWSYIRRYPRGPHVADAHRRLGILSAAFDPPAVFDEYDFGIAAPPPDEYDYVSGPVMIFDEADYPPPPPPPIYFLPPRPREYIELPPPRFASPGFLPIPVPVFRPTARPWRGEAYRQPAPVRLPGGVTPRDPGAPPRFVPPVRRPDLQQQVAPRPQFQPQQQLPPQQQRPLPGVQAPLVSPQITQQPTRQQQFQQQQQLRQQGEAQRQQQMRAQQLQQQRDQQSRAQQFQQQRAQQQLQQQTQQRAQQQQLQQRAQQQQLQQRAQQQQQMQQRAQQQQFQQQRAQQQQMQQQRAQQQQFQQQRAQQQQQMQRAQQQQQQQMQMQRAQQQQQQMQMQRAQQQQQQMQQRAQQQQQMQQRAQQQQMQQMQQMQRAQQQQQQQRQQQQQQRPQRNDCGVPGKPPCR
ncbi:MAG: peptidase caspase catalytic subunit p20 [Hyphomicrobiales bacterium]|nr:peptidase caspase catalytic subunit p20 [Hyphomicrobiales bacterium]